MSVWVHAHLPKYCCGLMRSSEWVSECVRVSEQRLLPYSMQNINKIVQLFSQTHTEAEDTHIHTLSCVCVYFVYMFLYIFLRPPSDNIHARFTAQRPLPLVPTPLQHAVSSLFCRRKRGRRRGNGSEWSGDEKQRVWKLTKASCWHISSERIKIL